MAPIFARGTDGRSRGRRWTDRALGIAIGLLIGLGVLVYFVFVHSEGTIDAPKVNGGGETGGASTQPEPSSPPPSRSGSSRQPAEAGGHGKRKPAEKKQRPVPVVRVIGGAPPTATGPKQLTFRKGEEVRFEIETSEPFAFEIKGLGVTKSIESSSVISFKARKAGQFPVIATATLIGVADLLIKPRR